MGEYSDRRDRLRAAAAALRAAEAELDDAVANARLKVGNHYTHVEVVGWAEIGEDLGITRQAANKRWKHVDGPRTRALPNDSWYARER